MNRIPVRIRVAAAFAVTMAIVLSWAAYLLYVDVGKELTEAVDRELQVRAHDLTLVVGRIYRRQLVDDVLKLTAAAVMLVAFVVAVALAMAAR